MRTFAHLGTAEPFFKAMLDAMALQKHEHLAMLIRAERRIGIFITVFSSFVAFVDLSSAIERYDVRDVRDGGSHGILLDAAQQTYTPIDWPTMLARGRRESPSSLGDQATRITAKRRR